MTVDMLAAAFLWPEEMLVGRTRIGNDLDPVIPGDPSAETPSEAETMPFWAALMQRFRAEASSPGTEAR